MQGFATSGCTAQNLLEFDAQTFVLLSSQLRTLQHTLRSSARAFESEMIKRGPVVRGAEGQLRIEAWLALG